MHILKVKTYWRCK